MKIEVEQELIDITGTNMQRFKCTREEEVEEKKLSGKLDDS